MSFPTKITQLCTPAYVYFFISIFALILAAFQNIGNTNQYTLGMFSCNVPSCVIIFIIKIIYILFWTWVLNLICKDGYTWISWLLVLLPFLLLFVILGIVMIYQKKQNGKKNKKDKKK